MPERTSHNVIHVVDSLERGGLERVVTDLACVQRDAGHRVAVFCLYRFGPMAEELRSAGIEVTCGEKRDGLDLRALWRLRRRIRALGCEIVHAHNFVPNYYSAMAMLGLLRAPALVCSCHDMGTRLSDPHLRRMFTWSLARTRGVAMVADQVYEKYVGEGIVPAERAELVLNGVPTGKFQNTPESRARARSALGLPGDALVLGAVGRLVPLKNHRALLALLPSLLQTWPTLRLVLLGDGELRPELEAQARDLGVLPHVVFAGARSDVSALLPGFDVFAQPSLTEGLSIALLEAASAGLAIVASAVGGNLRIVREGENGLLFGLDEPQALERALRALLGDPGLRTRLGRTARSWVAEHASIEAMERAYAALYARVSGAAVSAGCARAEMLKG